MTTEDEIRYRGQYLHYMCMDFRFEKRSAVATFTLSVGFTNIL